MAGESCNLNEDEAEILKPSSSSASPSQPSPPAPPPSSSAQPPSPAHALPSSSLFLKPSVQEFPPPERPELLQTLPADVSCLVKLKKELQPPASSRPQTTHWCSSCHKKVGLTGFRCRCGELFCVRHRYSDTHDCSFDYKAAGREQIAKENPLIRAAKIIKI